MWPPCGCKNAPTNKSIDVHLPQLSARFEEVDYKPNLISPSRSLCRSHSRLPPPWNVNNNQYASLAKATAMKYVQTFTVACTIGKVGLDVLKWWVQRGLTTNRWHDFGQTAEPCDWLMHALHQPFMDAQSGFPHSTYQLRVPLSYCFVAFHIWSTDVVLV